MLNIEFDTRKYCYLYVMYYVYILTNKINSVLYTGITNDIDRRLREHTSKAFGGFTARYNVYKLVYVEQYQNVKDAIAREKQIKSWRRSRKQAIINMFNPEWDDLSNL